MKTMNKKAEQRQAILNHGFKLLRVFPGSPFASVDKGLSIAEKDPIGFCGRVHRLEQEAHRFAEKCCNEDVSEAEQERKEASIMKRLNEALGPHPYKVFINMDPRGYALKIDDEDVKRFELDIHRDMGGYGIIAPDFRE